MTNTMNSESRAVLDRMKKACRRRQLIPFVGAGFTRNIQPALNFKDFVNNVIADHLPIALPSKPLLALFEGDTAKALDFVAWRTGFHKKTSYQHAYDNGKESLCRVIAGHFSAYKLERITPRTEPLWSQHLELLRIPTFDRVYTTNWDPCLETAIRHLADSCDVPLRYRKYTSTRGEANPELWPAGSRTRGSRQIDIVKFHGDIEDYETVIATETDYSKRIAKPDDLDEMLKRDGGTHGLLFVGYSFGDANVQYVLSHINHVSDLLGQGGRTARKTSFMIDVGTAPRQHIYRELAKYIAHKMNLEICYLFGGAITGGKKKRTREALARLFKQLACA